MNDVEYVLRIVLKARDELAAGLAKARTQLKAFAKDVEDNQSKINAFNQSMETMEKNVGNITDKFREWRAVLQGVDKDNDDARKSFGDLGKEVEQTTKKQVAAAKQQSELIQLSRRLNKEAKELAKTEHESARDKDYQVKQLKELGKALDALSGKMTGAGNKRLAFDWARSATEAADRIVAEEKRKVAAVEQAEKDKQKALDDTNKFWLKLENAAFKQHQKNLEAQAKLEKDESAKRLKILEAEAQRKAYLRQRDADAYRAFGRSRAAQAGLAGGDATHVDIAEARRTVTVLRQIADRYEDGTKSARRLRGEAERLNDTLSDFQKVNREVAAASAKAANAERDHIAVLQRLNAVKGRMEGGSPLSDVDADEARDVVQHLRQVSSQFQRTSREARGLRAAASQLNSTLRASGREVDHGIGVFRQLGRTISENKESVATLDNQLRGIGWLAAFTFAQELITVLGGLGGAFVAVASSAAQAGAAIGGTFVAGIAQALPSIGLLGAAMSRVGSVMDVVKQAQTAQQAAAVQGAGAHRRTADAADTARNAQDGLRNSQDGLRDSQEGLADAQRRLAEAQGDITTARREARRDLEDLIAAEKRADLAARGAVLSQKEAQEQLRLAMASGDVEGIARAELAVLEAQADAEEKLTEARRARVDAGRARRGGVEGMEGVQQAKQAAAEAERSVADARRGIENAERAVAKAARGIETAKRNASEAAAGTQTAAATLNYLLAQLSPAERRLYTALQNIQEAYKKTYRPITDLIIDSFTRSVQGVQKIMLMPEVISMARRTAQQIARQMNRIFDAFTTAPMIKQFLRIAEEGRKNLAPLATIVIRLGRSFANIAEAGGPALRRLIKFVGDLVEQFEKLTSSRRKMAEFFIEGEKHFEAWVRLGLAVIRLFLALAGAGGAETGVRLVKDATKAINDLIKDINANKGAVADFFGDSRQIVHEVVGIIVALAKELRKAFTPENVAQFADLLKTVVIPAIGTALEWISRFTTEVLKITSSDLGRTIATFVVSFFLFSKVIGSTLGLLIGFGRFIGSVGRAFGSILQAVGRLVPVLGRLGAFFATNWPQIARAVAGFAAPWLLIAGAVVFLLDRLGLLDDAWEAVKGGFQAFWKEVAPSLDKLVDNFKSLWDAVSDGEGIIGVIGDILKPVLEVVIEIGAVFQRVFGRLLGRIFGGAIDILGGFFKILEGIIRLDVDMIWEGLKKAFSGLLRMATSVFRAVPELLREAFRRLGPLAGDAIRAIIRFFSRLPGRVWEIAKDVASFFGRGFRRLGGIIRDVINGAWNWLRRLPGRFWELAKDIASRFWRGYQRLGRLMRNGIEDAWDWIKRLPGRFWELAKDIASFFWRGYRALGRRMRSVIEDAWDWIKGFPKRFEDLAKDAVKLFVGAFKGLGKKIIDIFSEGLSGAGNFAKKLINGIFKLIEDGWNRGIGGKKVLGVSLPDIKIPRLAAGGPIPGSGKGDRFPALLEAGEHVWTAAEVRRAGGHEAMYAMRRFFGGGGQSLGGRFAEGGRAGAGGGNLSIAFKGGDLDEFLSQWRTFWTALLTTTRRSVNLINSKFRDMRTDTARWVDRMYRDVRSSLGDMENSFKSRGNRIVRSWSNMWTSLKKVTYDGLNYIGHETNKALKGMGEKTIDFGLSEPKKADNGKAVGGWIKGKGQRGKDLGFYALGAGEAVLNWQHQAQVEPAMHAYYGHGLSDMFRRTRGYHAGGPEQPGFAAGRLPSVLGSKPGFGVFMQLFRKLAGNDVYVMSGSRPGATTTSGNVSNHASGNAIDISNQISQGGGPGNPPPQNPLDNLHKWIGKNIPAPPRLDFLWRTMTGGNHYNHIHLGLDPAVTATIQAAQNYIKKNLGEEFGSLVGALDPIKKRFVTPKGLTLSKLAQKALDKVLKGANKMLSEITPEMDTGGPGAKYPGGAMSQQEVESTIRKALDILNITNDVGLWVKTLTRQASRESSFNPNAVNDWDINAKNGDPSKGLIQIIGSNFARYKHPGHDNIFNPLDNILSVIKYTADRYGGGNYSRGVQALWARGGGAYAKGGEIPGGEGKPVPILAHAREWILNMKQQQRLTQMLGIPRNMLKNVLGFPSRSGQAFATGGEVDDDEEEEVTDDAEDDAKLNIGITTKEMRERIRRIRRGLYELPALPIQSWQEALREAKRAFLAIKRSGKAMSLDVEKLTKDIKELEKGDESKAETKKIKELKAERKALIEGGTMVKEIEKVNKEIEKLQKGDEDKEQLKEIKKLERERKKLQRKGRAEVAAQARLQAFEALVKEGGIIETLDAARERFTARIARTLTFATFRFNRAAGRVTERMDEVEVATQELENTRREMRRIFGQRGIISRTLRRVNNRLRQLRRGGINEDEADEVRKLVTMQVRLREQHIAIRDAQAEQLQRIYDAQEARRQAILDAQQEVVDEINSRAERDTNAQEIRRRIGEALGDEGILASVVAAQRDIMARHANELEARIASARQIGNTEAVNELTQQVADLRTQIFESIQQELRDAADRINARTQRRLGRLDLGSRMLDAIGAVGLGSVAGVAGEQFSRGGLFGQRGATLAQQRAELQGVLGAAMNQGNIALIQDLTDQLAELDVTIQENTKAYFDARVEEVNSRIGFSLNINDLMKQIAELEGTAAGQLDQARISNLLMERGNILSSQRLQLEALLAEAQATGNQQAINDLTVALLENQIATLQNTAAIDEANGLMKDPQSFTSTAWTWFREAIFSGMGQVLPQYDPINLMGGVNTGAVIYPAVTNSTSTGGNTNITLNEVGRPVDLTEVSSVIAFASKTAQ